MADSAASGGGGGLQEGLLAVPALAIQTHLGVSASVAQVLAWFAFLLGAYTALQIVLSVASKVGVRRPTRKRGKALLILGQCGSGKTNLFFRLRDPDEDVQTVSSLKPLRETMKVSLDGEELTLDVVDYPGHQRFYGKSAQLIPEARCIVYVIDAEDKQRLKDVAEHLYELMTSIDVCELKTPILLCCNKSDLTTARTDKFIVDEIEREIEQMRVSRAATLEGQDQADSYLGVDGEKFKLLMHAPCPVEVCRISAKQKVLKPLFAFISEQLGANASA